MAKLRLRQAAYFRAFHPLERCSAEGILAGSEDSALLPLPLLHRTEGVVASFLSAQRAAYDEYWQQHRIPLASHPPTAQSAAVTSAGEADGSNVQQKRMYGADLWSAMDDLGHKFDEATEGGQGRRAGGEDGRRGEGEEEEDEESWRAGGVDAVGPLAEEEDEPADEVQKRRDMRHALSHTQPHPRSLHLHHQRPFSQPTMAPSLPLPLSSSSSSSARQSLIVVASLVSSAPNVAGLARTAEVFQVSGVCVASSQVLLDPLFLRVSVSAHRWLPMMELPVSGVRGALDDWRAKGWTVVALEQSRESVSITSFHWPAKVVLLLGHEREGVPVSLLNAVDRSVEIPQAGRIRSLNVHTAASIAIYDFTCKRMQPQKVSAAAPQ